jgi:hypothetical protein
LETSVVDLAKTTTSGVSAANHLSPLCAANVSGSSATAALPNKRRNSPATLVLMLVIVIVLDEFSFD